MVQYHLKVKAIVYKYISEDPESGKKEVIYMVKSITQDKESYNVVGDNDVWICDCPSYKYQSATDEHGHCKHIRFVKFLLDEHVEITII